jgi:HEAT repeat protein
MLKLQNVNERTWKSLRSSVIAFLPKVRGAGAVALCALLQSKGEEQRAIKMLTSKSAVHRARATYLLGLIHTPNLTNNMLPLLEDRSREVRLVATRVLGSVGAVSAASSVLQALHTKKGFSAIPTWAAVEALLAMGNEIGSLLETGLKSEDPGVQNVCTLIAGHGTFFTLAPLLRELLTNHTDIVIRINAAVALSKIGGVVEERVLERCLDATEPAELRRACVQALGVIGRAECVDTLVKLLDDNDRRVAQLAADSLVQIGELGYLRLKTVIEEQGRASVAAIGALKLAELREQVTK